jgi:hypothetical protein
MTRTLRLAAASAVAFGIAGASLPASVTAAGVYTAPHRAAYTFKLKSARADSGIVDITGGMTFEVADSCDGWTVNQRIVLRMLNRQNNEVVSVTNYSSWESKDGRRFRFNSKTTRNGRTSEQYRGTATLRADGSGGEAKFTLPKAKTMKLPKGSVFPTAHAELVMRAAERGENFVWRVLFDGTTDEGPYGASAVISKPKTSRTDEEKAVDKLLGKLAGPQFWTIRLGFFQYNSKSPNPEYDLSVGMNANSVARWLVMDYGTFVIDARLAKIQALPKSAC